MSAPTATRAAHRDAGGGPASGSDSNRRVSRATAVMSAGTLLSRLTGFGRVIALGWALGLGRLPDVYNLANNTPNIVYELVLGGVLSATLVPVFISSLSTDDDDDAWRAISAVVTATALTLVALTVVFYVSAPAWIRLYSLSQHGPAADEQRQLATSLLRMFVPQVAVYGFVSVATALLNARRRFAAPMFAPVLNNLVVIAVVVGLRVANPDLSFETVQDSTGERLALGVGTTLGVVAMGVALLPSLLRSGALRRLRPVFDLRHEAVRTVLRLSGWTFGAIAANQLALLVILVLAYRENGGVSAYNYAYTFFLLPHGVFAVSLMTALLPDLSETWARQDIRRFRDHVSVGLRTTLAVIVPAAVGYVVLARPIVTMILGHGEMDADEARLVGDVLAMFSLGLPGVSGFLFLTRAYSAMKDTRTMFVLYAVENALNVVLALALYAPFGVQGLAFSFSMSYYVALAGALWDLRRRLGGIDGYVLTRTTVRVCVASAVMGAVTLAVSLGVGGSSGLQLVVRVFLATGAGLALYVAATRTMRIRELAWLLPRGLRR